MAVTGIPIIAPASGSVGVRHRMDDIYVDTPTGQDGVWSAPAAGTRVSNLTVDGASGTDSYGLRVGATSGSDSGIYTGMDLIGCGFGMTYASRCLVSDSMIRVPRKHGVYLYNCDENMFENILIQRPSYLNTDTYDGIHASFSDDNMFNGIMIPESGTTYMGYSVNFTNSYDNQLNAAMLDAGRLAAFKESAYLDNDFGLEMSTWSLAKVIDTTGTGLLRLPFGADCEVYAIELRLGVAPTGTAVIVDVNQNGSSIFPTTTKPQIPTSGTSGAALPDTTFVAASSYLTVDIDQADSAGDAEGLTVTARWRRV